ATMASAEFDEEALEKRPTVQVGDPFLEKLLLEACLEAMRSGAIAGIQDMGAAGLTSSSCEMAARAGTGLEIDLTLVPQREQNMTAYEIMLSESQERMLIVAHKGREREVVDIFRKWDLDAVVIGRVTDSGRIRVLHNKETTAEINVSHLTDEAPLYERPMRAPDQVKGKDQTENVYDDNDGGGGRSNVRALGGVEEKKAVARLSQENEKASNAKAYSGANGGVTDHNAELMALLAAPNIASKEWVFRQYDHMVRTNTVLLPGADAAVVRIKETRRALAISLDGNGRYCAVNPREGAKLIVAESARNVVCTGALPLAITNCLNFASPENPETMWAFSEVIDGLAEACRALQTPVISGNVSFYNETFDEGVARGIPPTPVVGMVGVIEDVRRIIRPGFKTEGQIIALLGETNNDISVSEYAATIQKRTIDEMVGAGSVPALDMARELAVQRTCLRAAEEGLLISAHDLSDGGLAVALAESCFSTLNAAATGAQVSLQSKLSNVACLFSESPSRIVISFGETLLEHIREIAYQFHCPLTLIGRTGGDRLRIAVNDSEIVSLPVEKLERVWRTSLAEKLEAEAVVAAAE
ncbi:MAG: phosphoribosylformylglycinamidine synthase II, partial [Pyrinomonadaceae bacterium]|nr:phosphoribosylformylglycinamidine synthase II [Pyrinomonadaceae bacterium]